MTLFVQKLSRESRLEMGVNRCKRPKEEEEEKKKKKRRRKKTDCKRPKYRDQLHMVFCLYGSALHTAVEADNHF